MSEAKLKVGDVVDVVAVDIGYRNSRLVYPGAKFKAVVRKGKPGPDGKEGEPRLPKWVQLADQPLPAKATVKNGDLKPADAQAALKRKQGELSGGVPGDGNLA